jgi:hypothetical protein
LRELAVIAVRSHRSSLDTAHLQVYTSFPAPRSATRRKESPH